MKMKIIFALIAASIMLSACENNNSNDNEESPVVSVETIYDFETNKIDSNENISETESTKITKENTEASDVTDTDVNISEDEERNKIKNSIIEVINKTEHAFMDEVTDPTILSEFFLIDVQDEKLDEIVVYQCPMSATMSEIIVLKSSDSEYAKGILEARKEKAISQDAWYPADQENAAAAVVDSVGDYSYFILNGSSADDAIYLSELLSK